MIAAGAFQRGYSKYLFEELNRLTSVSKHPNIKPYKFQKVWFVSS